jgi:hypothetical protein
MTAIIEAKKSNIVRIDSVTCKQDKYQTSFKERLAYSQELVDEVAQGFLKNDFWVRSQDDQNSFVDKYGNTIRLTDVMVIHSHLRRVCHIECKDFSRCLRYDATGLPKSYIDNRMNLLDGGVNVVLVFRDNIKWFREKVEKINVSEDFLFEKLKSEGFMDKVNGEYVFVPYGNKLSFLMNNVMGLEIHSKFKQHKGECNYMWPTNVMIPLPQLPMEIIESSKGI